MILYAQETYTQVWLLDYQIKQAHVWKSQVDLSAWITPAARDIDGRRLFPGDTIVYGWSQREDEKRPSLRLYRATVSCVYGAFISIKRANNPFPRSLWARNVRKVA